MDNPSVGTVFAILGIAALCIAAYVGIGYGLGLIVGGTIIGFAAVIAAGVGSALADDNGKDPVMAAIGCAVIWPYVLVLGAVFAVHVATKRVMKARGE